MRNEIEIQGKRMVGEIQREFNEVFPFLKIEFFSWDYKKSPPSRSSKMARPETMLILLKRNRKEGCITLNDLKTVSQFEAEFQKRFGLHVQVFRRTGKLWIETNLTNEWTLEKQNNEGADLTRSLQSAGSLLSSENEIWERQSELEKQYKVPNY